MEVKVGDIVSSDGFGSGPIIAMTKDWCIYEDQNSGFPYEVALPWDEIYILATPPQNNFSSIDKKDLTN